MFIHWTVSSVYINRLGSYFKFLKLTFKTQNHLSWNYNDRTYKQNGKQLWTFVLNIVEQTRRKGISVCNQWPIMSLSRLSDNRWHVGTQLRYIVQNKPDESLNSDFFFTQKYFILFLRENDEFTHKNLKFIDRKLNFYTTRFPTVEWKRPFEPSNISTWGKMITNRDTTTGLKYLIGTKRKTTTH